MAHPEDSDRFIDPYHVSLGLPPYSARKEINNASLDKTAPENDNETAVIPDQERTSHVYCFKLIILALITINSLCMLYLIDFTDIVIEDSTKSFEEVGRKDPELVIPTAKIVAALITIAVYVFGCYAVIYERYCPLVFVSILQAIICIKSICHASTLAVEDSDIAVIIACALTSFTSIFMLIMLIGRVSSTGHE